MDRPPIDPRQKAAKTIRPQTKLDLIISLDLIKDVIDVRSTIIYDINEKQIFIAQTEPPILKSMLGQEIEATFLVKPEPGADPQRWGFLTRIRGLMPNYRLKGEAVVSQALILSLPTSDFRETGIRMFYRVSIIPEYGITFQIPGYEGRINLLDLSAGGAQISFPGPVKIPIGQIIPFILNFKDGSSITGQAEVRKISERVPGRPTLVGLKFNRLPVAEARLLQRQVNYIMFLERQAQTGQISAAVSFDRPERRLRLE